MLTEFAKWLIIDKVISILKAIPVLAMLTLATWMIAGMVLSCIVSD